ncbi:uncharacterized protein [Littorina saxatilis]|uniref:uncharacterized protein isoform X2 n=1 Tax=Littorina saxatilis TaxID=31220 RepID=UPI0038B6A05E
MSKTLALVVALVAVVVVAQDYYYDSELCQNVQPGLWKRDPQDCMVAHQCGFDAEITQSVRCNASQVWSKLANSCVWEWDPDRDDCNGSPQVPMPNQPLSWHSSKWKTPRKRKMPKIVPIQGQSPIGLNPFGRNPQGINPQGISPQGTNPIGENPMGTNPEGLNDSEFIIAPSQCRVSLHPCRVVIGRLKSCSFA